MTLPVSDSRNVAKLSQGGTEMTQPMDADDAVVKKPRKKKRSKAGGRDKTNRDAGMSGLPRTAIAVVVALAVGVGIGRVLSMRS